MYTKLFNSIITSTVWLEADATRIVWITLLAMADRHGEVMASVPGLARVAGVDVEACRQAIATLMAPDPDSRTKDQEGRRLEAIDGGWLVINYHKYREMAASADRAEKAAVRQRRKRDRDSRNVTQRHATVTQESRQFCQAEAEAEAEIKHKRSRVPKTQSVPVAEFEDFWNIYPRKIAKGAAEKAWKTACKHTSFAQTIIDAAKRFAVAMADQEKTFIKHPATWLNGQCWLDELPEPAEKVCRWPYDDTDIHTPEGMALLTKTFLENQHRA